MCTTVCRFHLDKKCSELGCLASDSNSNLSNSTADHNIDTDSSLEHLISLGNLCFFLGNLCYKRHHYCSAEMMIQLVNHKKQLPK